jgi:hypothetical protein
VSFVDAYAPSVTEDVVLKFHELLRGNFAECSKECDEVISNLNNFFLLCLSPKVLSSLSLFP